MYILLRCHSESLGYRINFRTHKKERKRAKTFYGNSECFESKGAQKTTIIIAMIQVEKLIGFGKIHTSLKAMLNSKQIKL